MTTEVLIGSWVFTGQRCALSYMSMDSSFILFTLLLTEIEPATETYVFNKDKVMV